MGNTLSHTEAAAYLKVSYRTMRRYIKKGLPFREVHGVRGIEYQVDREDLAPFRKKYSRKLSGPERTKSKSVPAFDKTPSGQGVEPQTPDNFSSRPTSSEAEFLTKKIVERLESENTFLREQMLSKDRQLAVKDNQLADYHDIVKRLSHQNEVLTMIAQGIEPMKLLKGKEMGGYPGEDEGETGREIRHLEPVMPEKSAVVSREEIVARAKTMHKQGRPTQEIREFIQAHGYDSFSDLLRAG
jgi:hypothetical protein